MRSLIQKYHINRIPYATAIAKSVRGNPKIKNGSTCNNISPQNMINIFASESICGKTESNNSRYTSLISHDIHTDNTPAKQNIVVARTISL